MKFKCANCGKQTKNIPYESIDKKSPIGWHWTESGSLCHRCYIKLVESLVNNNESSKVKICNSDIRN